MLKKMSALLLSSLILFALSGTLGVFAETETAFDDDMVLTISSSKECISSENTGVYESEEDIALKNSGVAVYEVKNVPENGKYMVTVSASQITSNSSLYYNITGECNGETWSGVGRAIGTATVNVGSFYLEKNKTNTLKLTVTMASETNAVILKIIKIARNPDIQISSSGETIIPALDYTNRVFRTGNGDDEIASWSSTTGDVTDWNKGKATLVAGNYGLYDIDVPKVGRYEIYTLTSSKGGAVNFYIDDEVKKARVTLLHENNYYHLKYTKLGEFVIGEGKHTLKIENAGGSFYFQGIKLVYNEYSLDITNTGTYKEATGITLTENGEDVAVSNGGTVTYELSDVAVSGDYQISVKTKPQEKKSGTQYADITAEVSGASWCGTALVSSSETKAKIGTFTLLEGEVNKITFTVSVTDGETVMVLTEILIIKSEPNEISLEEETIIPAIDYTNRVYRTKTGDDESSTWSAAAGDEPSWNKGKVTVAEGNYGIYDIDVPVDGLYSFYTLTSGKAGEVNFYIDDELIEEQLYLNRNDSYSSVRYTKICSKELTAGRHSLKIKSAKQAFYFQAIKVIYRDVSLEAIGIDDILASDYYEKEDNVLFENGKAVLDSGKWISYKLNVPQGGKYLVKINSKSEKNGFLNLSSNGEKIANIKLIESDNIAENAALAEFKTGENQFKLFCASGALSVESLSLIKISDDFNEKEFLNSINGAKNGNEVYSVLKSCGESLGIDVDNLTYGIWEKEPVLSQLICRDFDTADEVLYALFDSIYKEKTNGTVTLFVNGEKKAKLSSGNIKIELNNKKQKENSHVYVGLYEQNNGVRKLKAVSEALQNSDGNNVANFSNMVFENPENITWKFINLESKENIKPYDAFSNIYKEFYVSNAGNDENDGSEFKPFRTIARAKEKASEISDNMTGDIIINIAGGEYFLSETQSFTPENSGKNGYNIIYRGDKDNVPVFHGGVEVTDWEEYENGMYCANLSGVEEVRNLYIDTIAAERARSEYAYVYLEDYDDETTDNSYDGFVTSEDYFPEVAHPEDLETVWDLSWECQRMPVKDISDIDGKKVILWDKTYWHSDSDFSTNISKDKRFYLENALEFVDTEGEFFYDKHEKKIYYYPYACENLETAKTYVAKTEGLVNIKGNSISDKVENLIFENISFKYGAWNDVSENGLFGRQAESFKNPENSLYDLIMPGQFNLEMTDNVKIKNCEFSSLGSLAVAMQNGVSNIYFEGNILKDISGGGLSIGDFKHNIANLPDEEVICRNITVKNNVFRRVATEYRQCCAINSYYVNALTVKNNDIKGVPYSAVTTGWGWESYGGNSPFYRNVDISNNKIVNALDTLIDGASIYNLGPALEGKITENYLADNKLRSQVGIYLDAGSAYLNVHDNLVFSSDVYFMRLQTGYRILNNNIYNNYSNTEKYSKNSGLEDSNYVENGIITDRDNLSGKPQEIYDNAGLEEEFIHLLENVETPDYIRDYNKTKPQKEYIGYVEGTLIECGDYKTASGSFVNYGYELGMSPGAEAEYVITVPQAGVYDLYLNARATRAGGSRVSVNINNGESSLGTLIPYNTGSKMELVCAETVSLNEGENTIKLKAILGSVHLDYFYFKEVEKKDRSTIILEAEGYDSSYDPTTGDVTLGSDYVSFGKGEWIEFSVYLDEAGTYNMKVLGATQASKIYLTATVNDKNVISLYHFGSTGGYSPYAEKDLGDIALVAGFNKIRISSSSISNGGIHLDKFILTAK